MGKHREPEQPEENGASQYPASGEEGGVGKRGMGRGKLHERSTENGENQRDEKTQYFFEQ